MPMCTLVEDLIKDAIKMCPEVKKTLAIERLIHYTGNSVGIERIYLNFNIDLYYSV